MGRSKTRDCRLPVAAFSACLSLAVLAGGAGRAAEEPASPEPVSGYVGEAVCVACHSVEAAHWGGTIHARLFRTQPRNDLEARSCESCHGPGAPHVASPDDPEVVLAFTRESRTPVQAMNAMCLECHKDGALTYWVGSVHEWQDLACSDCHNPMARTSARSLLREDGVSRTCFRCHPEQRVAFRKRSHMPLLEGKVSCVDCHAPHGSVTDPLLRADTVNQLCYECHPEKRGPFLWEHAPVRESCLNCHRAHGSNHPKLLISPVPFLCQECHSQLDDLFFSHPSALLTRADLASDERLLNRGCTNCHAQIHGSNHPSGPRLHR